MPEQTETELHDFILKKLVGDTSEDEIIYEVCDQTGMDWPAARALVDEIKNEHTTDIVAGQIPIQSALAGVYALIGILLIVGALVYLYIILDVTQTFFTFISGKVEMNLTTLSRLLGMRCALTSWFELPSIFSAILLGIFIVRKNYQFLRQAWVTFFP